MRVSRRPLATKDPIFFVYRLEKVWVAGDTLGRTEEEKASGAKHVVENQEQLFLQFCAEVDKDIATGNEVELREGRIPDQAVLGENAHLTQFVGYPVELTLAIEKVSESLRRYMFGYFHGVATPSCLSEHLGVEVGREDLYARPKPIEVLAEQDRERVRLLAGGTAGHPDADWRFVALALHNPWQDFFGQCLKRFGIAEELGHADQEILEQNGRLRSIVLQLLSVVGDRLQVLELDPAPYATQERTLLIAAEIMPGVMMEDRTDFAQTGGNLRI